MLSALMVCSRLALAQECPVPAGADPRLEQIDAALRVKFLQDSLNHDVGHALAWRWGWVGAYGAITVAQFALVPVVATRPERYVGGVQAALAILPPLVLPLHVTFDAPIYDAKVKQGGASCALVDEGERILAEDAHNEAFGASWVFHLVNVVYNFIIFAVLEWGYHDLKGALLAAGPGLVLGEVQIFTQPVGLPDAWQRYKSAAIAPSSALTVRATGVGVSGTF
jgi:hypothetical protein